MNKIFSLTGKEKYNIPTKSGQSRRQFITTPMALLGGAVTFPVLLGGSLYTEPATADTGMVGLDPRYYPLESFQPELALTEKLAIVTGASRGIGREIATRLSQLGVDVIGTSRNVSAVLTPPTEYPLYELDISKPNSIVKFAKRIEKELRNRRIDILINNAGRLVIGPILPASPSLGSLYFDQLQLASDTLYHGHINVTQALLPLMPVDGYCRLLFTVSSSAYITGGTDFFTPWLQPYFSAKRALLAYANSIRATFLNSSSNIIVSTVNPYTIATTLAEHPNPIYTQPVGVDGISDNPLFNEILAFSRQAQGNGLASSFVADAYIQLLTKTSPPSNVVVGSNTEPFKSQGGNETLESLILAENMESAIPFS